MLFSLLVQSYLQAHLINIKMSKLNYTQFMDWIKTHPNEKNTHIVELHLSNQHLTYLPKEIGLCTQLKELYCCYNKLTSLPTELGLCTQLIHLEIGRASCRERVCHNV